MKIPAREDIIRNFVAACLVIRGKVTKSFVDKNIASSAKGRRLWEEKLREHLKL